MPEVIKRFSLLRRHAALDRARFLDHYERVHGPLAAAQAGFRQFAYRYAQNHVLADLGSVDAPAFDGISVTYQRPRADYRRGFFQHPDYANVRPDEEYLFDLSATVSLLGREHILVDRGDALEKAVVLLGGEVARPVEAAGGTPPETARKVVCNRLDAGSASALGVGEAAAPYRELWELWFASDRDRMAACRDVAWLRAATRSPPGALRSVLAVRELVVFSEAASPHQANLPP